MFFQKGGDDYENLLEDIYDKLDDCEADGELDRATIEALIARIATELGYVPAANDDDDEETEQAKPAAETAPPPLYARRKGHDPP